MLASILRELDFTEVPFRVKSKDTISVQYFAAIVSVALSRDIVMPIKEVTTLWISNREEWGKIARKNQEVARSSGYSCCLPNADSGEVDLTNASWFFSIFFPNLQQFAVGLLVMIITFWIIVQSEEAIELLKDFTAIQLISELDNIGFWLGEVGYFGEIVKKDTQVIKNIRIKEKKPRKVLGLSLRPLILLALLSISMGALTFIVLKQGSGYFFYFRQMI